MEITKIKLQPIKVKSFTTTTPDTQDTNVKSTTANNNGGYTWVG